jgi:hypothetical protein
VDIKTVIPLTTCLEDRPIQEEVIDDFLDERGILARMGDGCDYEMCVSWFEKKHKNNNDNKQKSLQSLELKFQLGSTGRNLSSSFKMAESLVLLKTLSTIRLDYDNKFGRGYSITCNVDDELKKNPKLIDKEFKKFNSSPTFTCSNSIVVSLPFGFVKKITLVGTDFPLPKNWRKAIKNNALNCN